MPKVCRGTVTSAAVLVAVLTLAVGAAGEAQAMIMGPPARAGVRFAGRASLATAPDSPGWLIVTTQHSGASGNASGYAAILAPSRADAWVFGGTNPGGASTPIAQHWDGSRWHPVQLPAGIGDSIFAASAASPRDIWAVSYRGGYALHWNGARWRVARRWHGDRVATGITAIGRNDVWVFGADHGSQHAIGTWHFDGSSWRRVRGPGGDIYRASAVSGSDIWAIAARGGVLRYNGREWRSVRMGRAIAGAQPVDVLAVSRDSVWVAADTASGRLVLAHWNGCRWARRVAPGQALHGRLAADGHGGVWVAALTTVGPLTQARVLHFSRDGDWTSATVSRGLGTGVSDLALVPGTKSMWASGGFLTRAGGDAAIWRYKPTGHAHGWTRPAAEAGGDSG